MKIILTVLKFRLADMEFIVITILFIIVRYDKIREYVINNKLALAILGYFVGISLISVLISMEVFDLWRLF